MNTKHPTPKKRFKYALANSIAFFIFILSPMVLFVLAPELKIKILALGVPAIITGLVFYLSYKDNNPN